MKLPFQFSSTVVHGEKVGRTIGFPTANLAEQPSESELEKGVHFGSCVIDGEKHYCLSYFGPRLIFGEIHNCFEIYIYDFDGDIYGQDLMATLTDFMRPPLQLNSLKELKTQLEEDKIAGQKILQNLKK